MALPLAPITNLNGSAIGVINNNSTKLIDEFGKTFYKDGSVNMDGPIDMDSNRIINLPRAVNESSPVTLAQFNEEKKGDRGDPGLPGVGGNTFLSLASLKSSSPVQYASAILAAPAGSDGGFVNGSFTYRLGNFTGRSDVVAVDGIPLSTGAFVRDFADGLLAQLPTVNTTPAILSQADLNTLSVDLLQFIPRSRWDAVRDGTSTYPEDDAFEAAKDWIEARAPFAILNSSARVLKLNEQHTINAKAMQLRFQGPLDMSGVAIGTDWLIRVQTQPAVEVNGQLDRRPLLSGLKIIGNGENNGATGIWYEDCNHLVMRDFGVRNCEVGIGHGENAYIIDHSGGYLVSLRKGFYGKLIGVNSGERITFDSTTFGGCEVGIDQDNGFGDTFVSRCSFDYPNGFVAPGACRFINVDNGRVSTTQCHFEGNNAINVMGLQSAFRVGGDGAAFEGIGNEVVFQDAFNNYLIENNNPSCPVEFNSWIFNAKGVDGRQAYGTGEVRITQRNSQGGGSTTNAGFTSEAGNIFVDPNFNTTLRGVSIVADGASPPVSPTDGTALKLTISTEQNAGGGKSLKIQKIAGAGTEASVDFFAELGSKGSLGGAAVSLAKPGAEAGPVFLTAYYAACHRNAADVMVTDRVSGSIGLTTINYTSAASAFIEYRFEGSSMRAPSWATHLILRANFASMPSGNYYAGRVLMTEIK